MKFEISQETLTATIEAMRDYQLRLEVEAAALTGVASGLARHLSQERLDQAEEVRKLFDFFAHL